MTETAPKYNLTRIGKPVNVRAIENNYAFIVIISLTLQFGTIVYSLYVKTAVSTIISVLELIIWGSMWLVYCNKKRLLKVQALAISPCLLLIVFLIIKLAFASGYDDGYFSPVNSIYQIYSIVYSISLGISVLYLPDRLKKNILKYFYILMTITVIPSYFYVFRDRDALRSGTAFGAIDFQYIYAIIPLLSLTLIALIHCKIHKSMRLCMWLAVVSNTTIVLLSNFATATVLIFFAVLLGLVISPKFNILKMTVFILVCVVLVLLFKSQIATFCLRIADSNLFGTVMKHRLQDIAKILSGDGIGWSFIARFELMDYSRQSFLKAPLFGISFDNAGYGDLGFHETWFTLLAYSGIFGMILVLVSFALFFNKFIVKSRNKYFKTAYFITLLIVLALSFFNPIFSKSILMIIMVIMPLVGVQFAELKRKTRKHTIMRRCK